MVTGGCSSLAWLVCWPFELLKNLSQSGNKEVGSTILQRATYIWRNQGLLGFYRGTLPGIQSVFIRNGASMVVMQYVNRKITERGWRQ